jgi:hypothetical protein
VTWDVEGSRGSHIGSVFLSEVVKHRCQLPGIGHGVTFCDVCFLAIYISSLGYLSLEELDKMASIQAIRNNCRKVRITPIRSSGDILRMRACVSGGTRAI